MSTKTTKRKIEQKGRAIQRRLIGVERSYYSEINELYSAWFERYIQVELSAVNLVKKDSVVQNNDAFAFLDNIFKKSKEVWGKVVENFRPRISFFGNRARDLSKFDFDLNPTIEQLVNPNLGLFGEGLEVSDFVAENVRLITNIGNQTADRIQTIITDGVKAGKSIDELTNEIMGVSEKFGEHRARLIARDQTQKLAGQLNRLRQQQAGINSYIWQTKEDDRVRPMHKARNQKVYNWDNPPKDGHPGQPIACRCIALPNV